LKTTQYKIKKHDITTLHNITQCRENGDVSSFAEMLDNIFSPLFAVSIDPSSDPALHYFLGGLLLMTAYLLPILSILSPAISYFLGALLTYSPSLVHCSTTLLLSYALLLY
jgi:AMP deaminase